MLFSELDTALWCERNPSWCPCGGRGWMLSDYDTWHRCGVHGDGVPHPEDEEAVYDHRAHRTRMFRKAFASFASSVRMTPRALTALIRSHHLGPGQFTPDQWVDAAEEVAKEVAYAARDEEARRLGYSCGLEMAMDEEATRERQEHGRRW